jgi:hypothetical protein
LDRRPVQAFRKFRLEDKKSEYKKRGCRPAAKQFDRYVIRLDYARPLVDFGFHVHAEFLRRAAGDVHAGFLEPLANARILQAVLKAAFSLSTAARGVRAGAIRPTTPRLRSLRTPALSSSVCPRARPSAAARCRQAPAACRF